MSSSSSRAPIVTSAVSTFVDVYDYVGDRLPPSRRSKRLAGKYLADGYRVVDQHSFDLTVEHRNDGSRHLVRGEDAYATFMDKNRRSTILVATGRATNAPPRELTDYEKGAVHIIDECETPNCDHPVHSGGNTTGMLASHHCHIGTKLMHITGELEFGGPETETGEAGEKDE
ncbi:hypothetical protein LTR15_008344 [Elasticomyces elasticus]|nr:hypothetical protein LTR15_008344 [Elasticomyces elasticus]